MCSRRDKQKLLSLERSCANGLVKVRTVLYSWQLGHVTCGSVSNTLLNDIRSTCIKLMSLFFYLLMVRYMSTYTDGHQ